MNFTYLFTAIVVSIVAWVTFASLNTLDNASKAGGCCEKNDCGKNPMDMLVWWAHLGIGIAAILYVLYSTVTEMV
jgi:hypothetical protein